MLLALKNDVQSGKKKEKEEESTSERDTAGIVRYVFMAITIQYLRGRQYINFSGYFK